MAEQTVTHVSGLAASQIAPVAAELLKNRPDTACLIITANFECAKGIAKDMAFFSDREIHILPEDDPFFIRFDAKSHGVLETRLAAEAVLASGAPAVVVAPVSAALKPLVPKIRWSANAFTLKPGGSADLGRLRDALAEMGYTRASLVEARGEYSIRGGILDLWATGATYPARVEFFDQQVEEIRAFDPDTQKSIRKLDLISVYPASETVFDRATIETGAKAVCHAYKMAAQKVVGELASEIVQRGEMLAEEIIAGRNPQILERFLPFFVEETVNIAGYLDPGAPLLIDDPDRIFETVALRDQETMEDLSVLLEQGRAIADDLSGYAGAPDLNLLYESGHELCFFTPYEALPASLPEIVRNTEILNAKRPARKPAVLGGHLDLLVDEVRRYFDQGFEVTFVCTTKDHLEGLRERLRLAALADRAHFVIGELTASIELTADQKVWLWDGDIFRSGKHKKKRSSSSENASPIRVFTDISKGDYVVHEHHGVGRYMGIEQLSVQGVRRDYLKVKYAGNDLLYVPVDQMASVQKYIGGGDATPRVNKLSGGEWQKAKNRVRAEIAQMAEALVRMAAERKARPGYAFSADTVWQKDFEDKFPYVETADQLKSIAAIKRDMERPVPMDRLLCGDVGYGKTEVAMRAVFKCVADGKQAAVLVPTTILASQHYTTFSARFEDFPFKVEMMSRFRTAAELSAIAEGVSAGRVDVVIGTHRLLSKDVAFKELGLLVIDEEQRFGVKHKEKILNLKKTVDVLTLTATPIPRTLHMSLTGLRDMDLIAEPPEDRYPVQTYVMEENDGIIRETLRRELGRGGQAYVIVSRISGIDRVAGMISGLVPEASVATGHGQMHERELEQIMADFIEGRYDVLVSTTIVESGIDIPNVNTILIMDADRFGLSQLYQLRGRVGRTNRLAFAYLLYKKNKVISEIAEKRLRTIREFTEFGAGFKIAMRDLEIRGAGNLLGAEQHGHMAAVGYELYCKMVEEAVSALSGLAIPEQTEDIQIDLPWPSFIPDDYISDEPSKLDAYREIAEASTETGSAAALSGLEDRYGAAPDAVRNLAAATLIRRFCAKAGIRRIRGDEGSLLLEYRAASNIRHAGIAEAAARFGRRLGIDGTKVLSLRLYDADSSELLALLKMLADE